MAEAKNSKTKWGALLALADQANEGFLSLARSAGRAARLLQLGAMVGLSKMRRGLFSGEEKKAADLANEGFLSFVRSAGKAARFIQAGTKGSPSSIEPDSSREKKEEEPEPLGHTEEIKESAALEETPGGSGSPHSEANAGPPGKTKEGTTPEEATEGGGSSFSGANDESDLD